MATEKIAYLEASTNTWDRNRHGGFISTWVFSCANGLRKLGYTVKKFYGPADLDACPITKHTVVRGNVRSVRRALEIVGAPQPKNIDIPKILRKNKFTGRKVWETTLGELRKERKPVFIKSLHTQKAWKGCPIFTCTDPYNSSRVMEYGEAEEYPDDYEVLASEIFNSVEEQRFYILNGKILNSVCMRSYRKTGALKFAQEIVKTWKNAPISYVLDIAKTYEDLTYRAPRYNYNLTNEENQKVIADAKKTAPPQKWVIVEVNEGFSAANLSSVNSTDYARMAASRWYEMVGFKNLAKKIASQGETFIVE